MPLPAEHPTAEQEQCEQTAALTDLDSDALVSVLSRLAPRDLARVFIAGRCMHDFIQLAVDARASRLGVSLAPFRGYVRLQVLHVKEDVREFISEQIRSLSVYSERLQSLSV